MKNRYHIFNFFLRLYSVWDFGLKSKLVFVAWGQSCRYWTKFRHFGECLDYQDSKFPNYFLRFYIRIYSLSDYLAIVYCGYKYSVDKANWECLSSWILLNPSNRSKPYRQSEVIILEWTFYKSDITRHINISYIFFTLCSNLVAQISSKTANV